jgi:hypothetical protein
LPGRRDSRQQLKPIALLDTPRHQDFSDETYRTLTVVEGAVTVRDAVAEGIKGASRSRPATLRGLPAARRADFDLRQQSSTARAAIRSTCWTRSSSRWRST